MPFLRDEARQILAARRIPGSALRVCLLLYLTGAVLVLPSVLAPAPRLAAETTSPQQLAVAKGDQRASVLAVAPSTVDRDEPSLSRTLVAREGDTFDTVASYFAVRVESIAYNSGLHGRSDVRVGTRLVIPVRDGALYAIRAGDTLDGIAARFQADARAIMDANRLYFEPDNFAVGKTILVPTTHFPDFDWDAAVARADPAARGGLPAPTVVAPMQKRLQWPAVGVITQYFSSWHTGVDVAAPYGAPIGASDSGIVSAVGWVAVGGLRVCVKHDWGLETCYYHTSAIYVAVGQRVDRGQTIAAIGLTGVTTGPHVHWEADLGGVLVNPLSY